MQCNTNPLYRKPEVHYFSENSALKYWILFQNDKTFWILQLLFIRIIYLDFDKSKHLRCRAALLRKEKVPLLGSLTVAILKLSINGVHLFYKTIIRDMELKKKSRLRLFTHRSCKEVEIHIVSLSTCKWRLQ